MATKIFYTQDDIKQITASANKFIQEMSTSLSRKKFYDKTEKDIKISLDTADIVDERKANLIISPEAWVKMYSLVNCFSTEVEWQGTVKRLSETDFLIEDILVFPHQVTAVTVTSDQDEYNNWLNSLDEEVWNKLKFHGHSHVNMGVSPSGTDIEYRKNVLNNIFIPGENEDDFYIFLITNKKCEIECEIFDLKYNAHYTKEQISIDCHLSNCDLSAFISEAKEMTSPKSITPVVTAKESVVIKENGATKYSEEDPFEGGCIKKTSKFKSRDDYDDDYGYYYSKYYRGY